MVRKPITSVSVRDAREMILAEESEIYLDMTYETGREVSIGFTEDAVEELKSGLEEVQDS